LKEVSTAFFQSADRRNKLVSFVALLLATGQFTVGYYCIYEVAWLGWDLVEPMTYTISQSLFVAGLFYSKRFIGQSTSYEHMAQNAKQRRLRKWFRKSGFDYDRLLFLETQLNQIQTEIALLETKKFV